MQNDHTPNNRRERLSQLAYHGKLTIYHVKHAEKNVLEEEDYCGHKIIYYAAAKCSTAVVQALLDKGIDINGVLLENDRTALMGALEYKEFDNAKLLLDRGANVRVVAAVSTTEQILLDNYYP
jgi:ankyrin repeat protein